MALLRTGDAEAVLSHETALAIHDISDVNPSRYHVTIPRARRIRRSDNDRGQTPDGHYGLVTDKAAARAEVLAAARAANPDRFTTSHDPKILALPQAAWINKPEDDQQQLTPAA